MTSTLHDAGLPATELTLHAAADPDGPSCLLALPPRLHADTPLIISVHGVTRQPIEHALAFAPLARAAGAALIVPFFSRQQHRRYQQLAHPRTGRRSDLALIEAVESLKRRHGLCASRLHLFGYSGGGQFVHRFAMAHPRRVAALAIGAAGWYTLPDETLPYPLGTRGAEFVLGERLDMTGFLRLPMRVWVGDRDDDIDPSLRSDEQINLTQGGSRIERARRWVDAVRGVARRHDVPAEVGLEMLPAAGHSFPQCVRAGLARRVTRFFFGDPDAVPPACCWQTRACA